MEKPPPPDSLSSYSEVSYYVRNKIELCLQNYMSLERTANYLEKNHQISKTLTHLVWEQLLKQNPVFFVNFDLRRKTALHLKTVNDLLTKQAVLMFENGLLDISDASTSVRSLLRQKHPERIHVLETLASKRKMGSASLAMPYANGISVAQSQSTYAHQDQVLNPASFAMPYANGISAAQTQNPYDQVLNSASFAMPNANVPSVAQWQIPNEQLNEHLYATNLPLPATNAIAVMRMPIPYDQQDQHLYTASLPLPTANGPSMTPLPDLYNQQDQSHQYSLPTHNELTDNSLGAPTFPPVDTDDLSLLLNDPAFADLPELDLGVHIGHNGPSFHDVADTLMHFDEQYQSNGLENGDIIDEYLCNNFDITIVDQQQAGLNNQDNGNIGHNGPSFSESAAPLVVMQSDEQNVQVVEAQQTMQSKKMCKRVDQQQQAGGYPESEALNNHDYIGHNGPGDSYVNSAAQLVTQPQHQNGHYQPQLNVPVETLQRGDISNDFEQKQSKRMCTSFGQQQAGRVKRHCPAESEALNNPNTGNETAVNQQRSSKARATTRSLYEWEQYESEQ